VLLVELVELDVEAVLDDELELLLVDAVDELELLVLDVDAVDVVLAVLDVDDVLDVVELVDEVVVVDTEAFNSILDTVPLMSLFAMSVSQTLVANRYLKSVLLIVQS